MAIKLPPDHYKVVLELRADDETHVNDRERIRNLYHGGHVLFGVYHDACLSHAIGDGFIASFHMIPSEVAPYFMMLELQASQPGVNNLLIGTKRSGNLNVSHVLVASDTDLLYWTLIAHDIYE